MQSSVYFNYNHNFEKCIKSKKQFKLRFIQSTSIIFKLN